MDDDGRDSKPQPGDTRETAMSTVSKREEEGKPNRRGKPIHTTPKPKKQNPISAAILSWLHEARSNISTSPEGGDTPSIQTILIDKAPKRWVVYEPMVLLPSGSFTSSPWPSILASSTADEKFLLWNKILREISPSGGLTHLAINEGIPLHLGDAESKDEDDSGENTLRSPSGLKILHGDFGPVLRPDQIPTAQDFEAAFWVSTKQNGITQIWAPRYTMFSRGNIKEKARLLADFPAARSANPHRAKSEPKLPGDGGAANGIRSESAQTPDTEQRANKGVRPPKENERWAIDLYAGIGYFVFSYAKLGFRLLCWEINPWSVEGLRRGALANGWDVVVLSPPPITSGTPCTGVEPPHSGYEMCSGMDSGPTPGQATDDAPDEYDRKLAELVIGTGSSTHSSTAATTDNLENSRDKSTHSHPKRRNTPSQKPQIIVLLESNEFAEGRIRRLRKYMASQTTSSKNNPGTEHEDQTAATLTPTTTRADSDGNGSNTTEMIKERGTDMEIVHINAGFLPTSSKIWPSAWRMMVPHSQPSHHTDRRREPINGWLHLHENVGVRQIEKRKEEIQGLFDGWSGSAAAFSTSTGEGGLTGHVKQEQKSKTLDLVGTNSSSVQAKVEHVEMVKTFAPDVWHVVFDVHVTDAI